MRRSTPIHSLRHCTQIEYLDTGVALTAGSKVESSARGFVRLSWDVDSWASDADGLKKPGSPAYKTNLVDGHPFGALVGRVGANGEVFFIGKKAGEGGVAAYVVPAMLLLAFVSQWNVRKFLIWEYDADAREIAGRLSALVTDKRPNSVRVGSSWQLEPTLNFYRQKNQFVWMQPVSRAPLDQAFDYYVVSMLDRPVMDWLGLKPLYQGQVSGTLLAAYPK